MSQLSPHTSQVHQILEHLLETIRVESEKTIETMDRADAQYDEQTTLITSLRETVNSQQQEIDRISKDFQEKLDRRDEEIAALRSRLNSNERNFGILSRAVGDMMTRTKSVVAVGAHAFNVMNRDAMGDKIVTQLRGRPQRPTQTEAADLLTVRATREANEAREAAG